MARGRLRMYLGAAPGVGKTYAMLAEGQRLRARGTDVVVGFVEPHGRRLTAALAEGLETIPRHRIRYRGTSFTEMDLDALLARHPQLALIDELAHTNVPGSKNAKRWQDVEELLDAGVDVVTTVNIQHLESLNDVVEHITGVPQPEKLPDEVARRADQIELVDISPETLRRRLVHGEVYPPDRIEAALTHYFRPGNLTALRELALLWLADRVEEGLQRYRAAHGIGTLWETRERTVVALTGDRHDETLLRRAARIAARTPGSDLLAVHVTRCDGLVQPDAAVPTALRTLTESLGGAFHQVIGDDVADALLQFARAENATQIVLGAGRRGRFLALLAGESVGAKVTRLSGPIDVHIVTHERAARPPTLRLRPPRLGAGPGPRRRAYALAVAALLLPALTVLLTAVPVRLGLSAVLLGYLLAVVVVALVGGRYPALAAAIAAGLLADYYATPPRHSFAVAAPGDVASLIVFVTVAVAGSWALEAGMRRIEQAARASAEASALTGLAADVLRGRDDLTALLERVRQTFGLDAVSLLEREPDAGDERRWYVVASSGPRPPEGPREADVDMPIDDTLTLAGRGRMLGAADRRVLGACAAQIAVGLAHRRSAREMAHAGALAAAERSRVTLLLAAVQDLRPALDTAQAALAGLRARGAGPTRKRADLLATAQRSVDRIDRLVADLLDLSRVHAGALDVYLRPVGLDDILTAVLDDLGAGGHNLSIRLPEDLPDVIADAALLTRVVTGLAADALRRSPPAAPPEIAARILPDRVEIHLVDHGRDLPALREGAARGGERLGRLTDGSGGDDLARRLCLDLTEAMGGVLRCSRTAGGGLTAVVTLPSAARRSPRADPFGEAVGERCSGGRNRGRDPGADRDR